MVIECSNCHARYNVDESKIPPGGVKVKCHKCQHIIIIRKEPKSTEPIPQPITPESPPMPDVQPPVSPPTPPVAAPEPPGEPEPDIPEPTPHAMPPEEPEKPAVPDEQPFPEAPAEQPSEPAPPEPPREQPAPEPPVQMPPDTDVSAPAAEPPVQTPAPEVQAPVEPPAPAAQLSEEDKKWHERARRLAKALASDLVLYNQDKVEEGLRNGTLADLLGPEIRRSWEYYCQQIPKHIVESTDHFKDQLNKIVGKGKEIFK